MCQGWIAIFDVVHPTAKVCDVVVEDDIGEGGAAGDAIHASTKIVIIQSVPVCISMGDGKAVKDGGGVYPTACNNVIGVVGVVAFSTNVTAEDGEVGFEIAL